MSELTPPEHISQVVHRVNERDRKYFEDHPTVTQYTRPYVYGEFWPSFPSVWQVVVTKLTPSGALRTRQAIEVGYGIN